MPIATSNEIPLGLKIERDRVRLVRLMSRAECRHRDALSRELLCKYNH